MVEKEFFAIKDVVDTYRIYCLRKKTLRIFTDSQDVFHILKKQSSGFGIIMKRLYKWWLNLSGLNLTVSFIKGEDNIADLPSRLNDYSRFTDWNNKSEVAYNLDYEPRETAHNTITPHESAITQMDSEVTINVVNDHYKIKYQLTTRNFDEIC